MRNGGVVDDENNDNDDDDEMKMAKHESPEREEEKEHFAKSPHRQCVVVFGNCCWSLSGSKKGRRRRH